MGPGRRGAEPLLRMPFPAGAALRAGAAAPPLRRAALLSTGQVRRVARREVPGPAFAVDAGSRRTARERNQKDQGAQDFHLGILHPRSVSKAASPDRNSGGAAISLYSRAMASPAEPYSSGVLVRRLIRLSWGYRAEFLGSLAL